jgi:hypothetical protein
MGKLGLGRYPFKLEVFVQRRPHMRDENLEMMLHIGMGVLKQIFDDERVDGSIKEVVFYYPERWMNIVEERSLYDRLEKFCPNLNYVKIITQSVYIIQCTDAQSVKILSSEDEISRKGDNGGLTQESTEGRLWYKNAMVMDFSKLQVL